MQQLTFDDASGAAVMVGEYQIVGMDNNVVAVFPQTWFVAGFDEWVVLPDFEWLGFDYYYCCDQDIGVALLFFVFWQRLHVLSKNVTIEIISKHQ